MQKMLMTAVHTYAKNYGWTRDYILDHVYLDEHFLLMESIEREKRQEYLMLANIQMLPHIEGKARKNILESLSENERGSLIGKKIETDFSAIEKAKQQLNNM